MARSHLGVALVTGASTGIGAVYADRLAKRGYDLLIVARNQPRLDDVAASIRSQTGRSVEVMAADLASPAELADVEARISTDGDITFLVNNAGIALEGGLLQNGSAELQRLINVNVTAPTVLAAAAAKAFVKRKSGAIINIASVLAVAPELLEGAYSGTKAYLLNLSLKLAMDLKDTGVRVQAVLPGATRTEIWDRSGIDPDVAMPGMVMAVDDLVDAALLGFDRGEEVTIPPLADETLWQVYEAARLALGPHLSQQSVAPRYRVTEFA